MTTLLVVLRALFFVFPIVLGEEKRGLWSWSKFFFVIAVCVAQGVMIVLPLILIDSHGPHAWLLAPALIAACVLMLLSYIPLIRILRRWKLPQERTS